MLTPLIAILAVLISIGWIVAAAYFGMAEAAGRGGAIAVAISFYFVFSGRDLGAEVYNALKETSVDAAEKIEDVNARINTDAATAQEQNIYLAFSSVMGTIAWGFGDIAARHMPTMLLQIIQSSRSVICSTADPLCHFVRKIVEL